MKPRTKREVVWTQRRIMVLAKLYPDGDQKRIMQALNSGPEPSKVASWQAVYTEAFKRGIKRSVEKATKGRIARKIPKKRRIRKKWPEGIRFEDEPNIKASDGIPHRRLPPPSKSKDRSEC